MTALRRRALVLGVCVATLAIFYRVRQARYLDSLPEQYAAFNADGSPFSGLDEQDLLTLGWAQVAGKRPPSSYIGRPEVKPAGALRIGVFGCSFVAGDEVAVGFDLPSLLQREFDAAGLSQVEVINFGVSGYGLHQAYLIWEILGRRYDLDYVVFLPLWDVHVYRDDSFAYHFFQPHARFVVAQDGSVERVPVAGKTWAEARRRYLAVFPPWRYVRYDYRHMPLFVKLLLPGPLAERTNPFYYRRSLAAREEEQRIIYAELLRRVGRSAPRLVVVTNDAVLAGLAGEVSESGASFLPSQVARYTDSFLYWSPWHWSALGNLLRARELFGWLTGRPGASLPTLRLSYELPDAAATGVEPVAALHDASVSLEIGKTAAGSFVHVRDPLPRQWIEFGKTGTASLLFLRPPATETERLRLVPRAVWPDDRTTLPVWFLPLPFPLRAAEELSLELRLDGKPLSLPLGRLHASSAVLGEVRAADPAAFRAALAAAPVPAELEWEHFLRVLLVKTDGTPARLTVRLGGRTILAGVPAGRDAAWRFTLAPAFEDFWTLLTKEGQFVDPRALPGPAGTLDLVVRDGAGVELRQPLLSYALRREDAPFERSNPQRIGAERAAAESGP